MKRGFTLVELLATIVVISIVTLIIFPLVSRYIGGAREDLYKVQVENIIKAAKAKALEEESILKNAKYKAGYISVDELQNSYGSNGKTYLESEPIKNPIDDSIMNGYVEISYDETNNSYTYKYLTEDEFLQLGLTDSRLAAEYIIDDQEEIYTNESKIGLFEDAETNTYYFKGINPKNYIKISDSTWNIISINKKTNEIKIAKMIDVSTGDWNTGTGLSNYKLTNTDLAIYKYLNETFYGNLSTDLKKHLKKVTWNVSEVSETTKTFSQVREEEAKNTVESYVGLLSVSDYAYATNVLSCRKDYHADACATNNYLATSDDGYFLMNPVKGEENIWTATTEGLTKTSVQSSKKRIPTVILKASAKISSGTGKSDDPYVLDLN